LELTPSTLDLKLGESVTIQATISTPSPQAVPFELEITLPDGLETTDETIVT
jgi:hypothetical protein